MIYDKQKYKIIEELKKIVDNSNSMGLAISLYNFGYLPDNLREYKIYERILENINEYRIFNKDTEDYESVIDKLKINEIRDNKDIILKAIEDTIRLEYNVYILLEIHFNSTWLMK